MKENVAVLIYRPNYEQFIVSCVGKCDIMRHQLHRFIICAVLLLSFISSYYFALQNEKNFSPKIWELILLARRRISKMGDHLHIHWIWAKHRPNDHQYMIQTVHADTQNRTEIGGWQSVDVTGTFDPRAGGEVGGRSLYYILRQRGITVQKEFPGLVAERETTLPHVHHRLFLKPRFLEATIYVTKYHQNSFLQFYIEIWQLLYVKPWLGWTVCFLGAMIRLWHVRTPRLPRKS